MMENRILGFLYNYVWLFKVQLGPLLFIKILLETAQLLSNHFPSGLSLCILYFLFHKSKRYFCNSSANRSASSICFSHFLSFS